jgi:hypothetical protein
MTNEYPTVAPVALVMTSPDKLEVATGTNMRVPDEQVQSLIKNGATRHAINVVHDPQAAAGMCCLYIQLPNGMWICAMMC